MNLADSFLNLSKKTGQDRAEKLNMIFRMIRIDNEKFFDYPEDKREDRVCVELEQGKIVKAVIQ